VNPDPDLIEEKGWIQIRIRIESIRIHNPGLYCSGIIYNLFGCREELQLTILAPVRYQEEFSSLGLPASSGVLLIGKKSNNSVADHYTV
jgi:hypothetical protein